MFGPATGFPTAHSTHPCTVPSPAHTHAATVRTCRLGGRTAKAAHIGRGRRRAHAGAAAAGSGDSGRRGCGPGGSGGGGRRHGGPGGWSGRAPGRAGEGRARPHGKPIVGQICFLAKSMDAIERERARAALLSFSKNPSRARPSRTHPDHGLPSPPQPVAPPVPPIPGRVGRRGRVGRLGGARWQDSGRLGRVRGQGCNPMGTLPGRRRARPPLHLQYGAFLCRAARPGGGGGGRAGGGGG